MAKTWFKILRGLTVKRDLKELRTLFLRYVADETLKPVKTLGRFILFGVLGSVFVGLGVVLLSIGGLRYLESFSVFRGSLSWIPYLTLVVVGFIVFCLTLWRIYSGTQSRNKKTT